MTGRQDFRRQDVVTAFLRSEGKILLVQRSERVRTFKGHWAGISGYLEVADPLQQARQEVREEAGLIDAQFRLVCSAPVLEVPNVETQTCWVVHPFLFDMEDRDAIRLDWENTALRWVTPEELEGIPTVPALAEALMACLRQERANRGPRVNSN